MKLPAMNRKRSSRYLSLTGACVAATVGQDVDAGIIYHELDEAVTIAPKGDDDGDTIPNSVSLDILSGTTSSNTSNPTFLFDDFLDTGETEKPTFQGDSIATGVLFRKASFNDVNDDDFAQRFEQGDMIGADSALIDAWTESSLYMETGNGPWDSTNGRAFIGFRMSNFSFENIQYGWIGVNYQDDTNRLTVEDWAYETEVDQGIKAGDTGLQESTNIVPEPSSATVIALLSTAAGLLRWRSAKRSRIGQTSQS